MRHPIVLSARWYLRTLLGLIVTSVLAFAWLAWLIVARSGAPTHLDLVVRAFVHAHSSTTLTRVAVFLSDDISPTRLGVLGALIALGMWLRGWPRGTVLLVVAMLGVMVIDIALKQSFHRERPAAWFGYPRPGSYGFPSGHSMWAMCYFSTIAALLCVRLSRWTARLALGVLAATMTVLVGLSRIYLGVHYPTDVVGGMTVGLAWVATVGMFDRAWEVRRATRIAFTPPE